MASYICLHRKLRDNWIYNDAEYLKVWIEILLVAKFKDETSTNIYEGITYDISYSEFIFGRKSWSKRLNISEQRLRTMICKFTEFNMIKLISKYSKFTIFSVVNFKGYNSVSPNNKKVDENLTKINHQNNHQNSLLTVGEYQHANQQNNQQSTTSQPPANHQPTTNNNVIKDIKPKDLFCPKSDEIILTNFLLDKIKGNNPKFKEPNIQQWAKEMDYILRVDKRSIEDVRKTIEWCQNDSFWKTNVLSVVKLRNQFDMLYVKMNSAKEQPKGKEKETVNFAELIKKQEEIK